MDTDSCIIRGGTVVCADRVLPDCDVVVIDGRIAAIEPVGASDFDAQPDATMGVLPVVDARGAYVAPGLIDIHSDYVENVASPRPSVVMDLSTSLYKADRELVSHGVTTIFHSLSVYGAHVFDHKPIRDFGNVSALIDRVAALRAGEERDHLIRHRLHMRVELDSVDLYDDIESFLRSGKVDLVSFMDHTPGQGQYRDLLVFGDTLKGYRGVGSGHRVRGGARWVAGRRRGARRAARGAGDGAGARDGAGKPVLSGRGADDVVPRARGRRRGPGPRAGQRSVPRLRACRGGRGVLRRGGRRVGFPLGRFPARRASARRSARPARDAPHRGDEG